MSAENSFDYKVSFLLRDPLGSSRNFAGRLRDEPKEHLRRRARLKIRFLLGGFALTSNGFPLYIPFVAQRYLEALGSRSDFPFPLTEGHNWTMQIMVIFLLIASSFSAMLVTDPRF